MANGQAQWDSSGSANNAFIVPFETEKNIASQMRQASAIGKLSRAMKSQVIGQGPNAQTIDVGASPAAVWTKEISSGDEVRFTLEQNLSGVPTYGDAKVRMGDYLAYMHANVLLNKLDTPAFPLQEEMNAMRAKEVIQNPESRLRSQIVMYLAEQHVIDFYSAFFRGASQNLMAAKSEGGRAVDLGLGAGTQVSPENAVVAGHGWVSGVSGTSTYENNLVTALQSLTDTSSDYVSLGFLASLAYALPDRKIQGISGLDGTPESKYYCLVDPDILAHLTAPGSDLDKAWRESTERSKNNMTFINGAVEYRGCVFIPDPWLKKFRPDPTQLAAGSLQWGTTSDDKRSYVSTSNIAPMIILGNGAMLEGHNGSVEVTMDEGYHGKGKSLAAHVKQSFMRTRYLPKDGRTGEVINQSSGVAFFYTPGLNF